MCNIFFFFLSFFYITPLLTYIYVKTLNLSSWFFAAAMANLRPQNLPLSASNRKFYYFSKNILFYHLLTQVVFKSDKVPKVSICPFLHFLIIVLSLPVCYTGSCPVCFLNASTTSRYITLKSSFVYFQFHLRAY